MGVWLIQIDKGLLIIGRQAGIEGVQFQRPRVQAWLPFQSLQEMPPLPAGGFCGQVHVVEGARLQLVEKGLD